jgi:hypothetical protein
MLKKYFSRRIFAIDKRSNRKFTNLRHNKKLKSLMAIGIAVIVTISILPFLLNENTQTPSTTQIDDGPPSSSVDPSSTPTPQESNEEPPSIIRDFGKILGEISSGVTQPFTPKSPGIIESSQPVNNSAWKAVATNAWQYFQPDIGVDRKTGLPRAGLNFAAFTDWDLGVYIQAVLDAEKIGLIGKDGEWGSIARLDKVLNFLETRELNSHGYPFWFYESGTGKNYKVQSDLATVIVDAVDTGKLFVALNNMRNYNPSWTSRINNIVMGDRPNYKMLLNDIRAESTSTSLYAYYVTSGFASFWPEVAYVPERILNNIITAKKLVTYGVELPISQISCEPLLHSVFELDYNPKLNQLTHQVYLAHEAKYNETGKYVAFSEGNSAHGFVYHWVVTPNGDTWKITRLGEGDYVDMNPIIYTKVSFSFLAIYNTSFAREMTVYLEKSLPNSTKGYYDGADYASESSNRHLVTQIGSNTNSLIISAARYAIEKN